MGKGDEKMLERGKMDRDLVEFVVIDQLVPKEHLLRKIDAAVDFTRLYEMVEPLYCEDNGRPSIDPVVCSIGYRSICWNTQIPFGHIENHNTLVHLCILHFQIRVVIPSFGFAFDVRNGVFKECH